MAIKASQFAALLALLLLIGCAEDPYDKWRRYEAQVEGPPTAESPLRLLDLNQSSLDQTCLDQGRTKIRGHATQRDIDELVAFVRAKWPRETIIDIRVTPHVARVTTGVACGRLSGIGTEIYFQRNDRNAHPAWNFELEQGWMS